MSKDIDISHLPPPDEELVTDSQVDISHLPPPENEPGLMDAASAVVGHFARGATFGRGDRIAASLESTFTNKTYEDALKEQYAKQAEREKNFPAISKLSELAGLVASPLNKIAGAVAAPFNALSKIDQLAKVKKLIDYMKVSASGAAMGAIAGEGYDNPLEKKDPNSMSSSAKGAIAGAVIGPLAKLAPWATGGAAVGATLANQDNVGTGVAAGATLGALVDLVSKTPKGQQFISALPQVASGSIRKPREWYDKFLAWSGRNIVPDELADKRSIGATGSKYVDDLLSTYQKSKDITDLAGLKPLEPVGEVWSNPEKKQALLTAIQNSFRQRQRGAANIPIESIEKALSGGEAGNLHSSIDPTTPIDEYLYTTILQPMSQRLKTAIVDESHPAFSKIQDPQVKQFHEMGQNLLARINKGELNQNLELAEKAGVGPRYGNINGMSVEITPEMNTSPFPTLLPNKSVAAMDAYKTLTDMSKGDQWASKIPLMSKFGDSLSAAAQLGKAGQRISSERMNPAKISESFVANPSFLRSIGQRNDSLGALARSAFNDMQANGQDGLKTKTFLFTMNPLFRKMILGDTTNKDQRNQESTSSTGSLPPP